MLIGLISGATLMVVGGTVWGFTSAAANGRLGRNMWAGIRTPSTGASDAAWLAGHRAALPASRLVGMASLLIGLAMGVDGIVTRRDEGSVLFWILFVIGFGGTLVSTVAVTIQASRAARAAT